METIIIIKNVLYNVIMHQVGHLPTVMLKKITYVFYKPTFTLSDVIFSPY